MGDGVRREWFRMLAEELTDAHTGAAGCLPGTHALCAGDTLLLRLSAC